LPKPCAMGRPREWPMREIINGIFYVMWAGCPNGSGALPARRPRLLTARAARTHSRTGQCRRTH
jgi:hypothetical protein